MNKLKAPKTEQIWIRITPVLKQKIVELAKVEGRTMSNMVAHLIEKSFNLTNN